MRGGGGYNKYIKDNTGLPLYINLNFFAKLFSKKTKTIKTIVHYAGAQIILFYKERKWVGVNLKIQIIQDIKICLWIGKK